MIFFIPGEILSPCSRLVFGDLSVLTRSYSLDQPFHLVHRPLAEQRTCLRVLLVVHFIIELFVDTNSNGVSSSAEEHRRLCIQTAHCSTASDGRPASFRRDELDLATQLRVYEILEFVFDIGRCTEAATQDENLFVLVKVIAIEVRLTVIGGILAFLTLLICRLINLLVFSSTGSNISSISLLLTCQLPPTLIRATYLESLTSS